MPAPPIYRLALALCLGVLCSNADAAVDAGTVVRFETNTGTFEVELNPTANPDLDAHVANFLNYVESGRFDDTVINRAQQDFVVQMGSFSTNEDSVAAAELADFVSIPTFSPVVVDQNNDGQVDFDTTGLTNTRGTISLALNSSGPNSGTSSFFVNLGDNSFLDASGFLPFAEVNNIVYFDELNALPREDLNQQLGIFPPALTFTDVPVVNGDSFVIIERAVVIPEPVSAGLVAAAAAAMLGLRPRNRRLG